ncbi:transcriptional regulator Kaiso [Corythoichthys intestinalis]|uniref:transcriptional regulator Kaiso n=1 Tax=Corythoichthys intestinalis TaxID=161448 RepID=UPI0025A571DC|nr:transcriptional regulator Kaiso [Corythoichthys intestinalis]XP_057706619.1 transcriptional regulator Kaiso [Corythoichthys intestinalis]XP_057706620.1 transcriptional regulator Kaiso [Corythoichthys intestinalis]XP_061792577.1 transcriptional regulator Kaiso-like [Nerophis lumbriciformis]
MPTLKLITVTDTHYSATLLKSLNEQRKSGLFCDVTIIVQDKKFRAHKTILSASSTYFHQLFVVSGQVIELNCIRAEIFEHVLNYIYSSKIVRIRSDLLEELMSAGQTLGVKFIANLATPLSQVICVPGLSKDEDPQNQISSVMNTPIISESYSISTEEFKQSSNTANKDEDSDDDVMFISKTDAGAQKASGDIICLDSANVDKVEKAQSEESSSAKLKEAAVTQDVKFPDRSPLHSPDSSSNNLNSPARMSPGSTPTTPARSSSFNPELPAAPQSFGNGRVMENNDVLGVQKKQIFTLPQQGDSKIRLLDISDSPSGPRNIVNPAMATKKTVTLHTAKEIDSISPDCKVYANIGENTYDIVPVKEDPGEGGSNANKEKRSIPEFSENPKSSPDKKKSKSESENHYELIMDGKTFYVCTVCKRPYVCRTSLRRHFNTHSWERKYPCRYCDKVFALAEYRTKHEIQHTGERRYQCLMCHGTFLNYQLLSNHCKQVHHIAPSGKKAKDGEDNIYRLLPFKATQTKAYSWSADVSGGPFIGQDGGTYRAPPTPEGVPPPAQSQALNWDDIFESEEHMLMGRPGAPNNVNPPEAKSEFNFNIPETY